MPQQQSAPSLFMLLFLLWMLFPEGDYQNQALLLSDIAAERLSRMRDALDVLNGTRWGDFAPKLNDDGPAGGRFVNLTGFRREDAFAWDDLDRFRSQGLRLSRHAIPPVKDQPLWDTAEGEHVWASASGTLHGEWVRRPGSVTRGFESYNLSGIAPGMMWMGDQFEWARNITGDKGQIMLRLEGNKTVHEYEQLEQSQTPLSGGLIRSIRGTASVEDTDGSGLVWDMRMYGIHWPRQGVIIMTTTSEKFEGIFGLPHLTPSADFFRSSQRLLNQTLAQGLAKKEGMKFSDQRMPWSSDLDNPLYTATPSPHCEYIMYAQVHPPMRQDLDMPFVSEPENKANAIQAIESELEHPLGAPIGSVPKLQMSTVIYSPDCAFFLESKGPPDFPSAEGDHLIGMKREVHLHQINSWVLCYAAAVFGQVYLLNNQMKESSTPSTMGRISFLTGSVMVVVDAMTFTASATWAASALGTFLPTLTLMFASFLTMTIGGSFLAKIYEVQLPESRSRQTRGQPATNGDRGSNTATATPASATPVPPAAEQGLPAPVTAGRPSQPASVPIIVPSDQDVDAEIAENAAAVLGAAPGAARPEPAQPPAQPFQTIIGRYILISLFVSFTGISSLSWYPGLRALFMNACAFCYMSLWVPQIHRNILRNCRRALTWQFVIGQSLLRMLPLAYFWLKADNFFYARVDRRAFAALAAWVWLQLLVLAAQEVLGPRFGIPAGWTPDAWDYHPVLREDNLEAGGLPIGLVAEDNPGLERTSAAADDDEVAQQQREKTRSAKYGIDCAICREALEVPVVRAGEEDMSVAAAFARRTYMVTPCRHIFHTACLEGWMRFRLQCPICREELPPL